MMQHVSLGRWLAALFFCLLEGGGAQWALGERGSRKDAPILFQIDIGSNGMDYVASAAALSKQSGNLVVAGASSPADTRGEGRLWLWEIGRNGERVRDVILNVRSERAEPAAQKGANETDSETRFSPADPRLISGLLSTDEGFVMVGSFGGPGISFVKLDKSGSIVHRKSIELGGPDAFDAFVRNAALLKDGGTLLVGHVSSEAAEAKGFAQRLDSEGNLLWQRVFDFGQSGYAYLSAAIPMRDERFVLVGSSGEGGFFELGRRQVHVLLCDKDGNVIADKSFAGRLPEACQANPETIIVVYDKAQSRVGEMMMQALGLTLKELWSKPVAHGDFGLQSLKVACDPTGGVMLAGYLLDDLSLRVYSYDRQGNLNKTAALHFVHHEIVGPYRVRPVWAGDIAFLIARRAVPKPPTPSQIRVVGVLLR